MPVGDGHQREVMVCIDWTNAVYTSDFLGGVDTITLEVLGQTFMYEITELSGDTCQLVIMQETMTADIIAEVSLNLDPDCVASVIEPDVTGCIYDLALIKEINSFGPFAYGDIIPFEITVENQGAQPLTNIKINDFLPSGFGFDTVGGINGGWIESAVDTLMYFITDTLLPGDNVIIPLDVELLMASGPDAWLNKAEIFSMEDTLGVDRSMEDIDSTPDADPDNDPGGLVNSGSDNSLNGDGTGPINGTNPNTDEDDEDPALVRVVDAALVKRIVTPPPYNYGDIITFEIEVSNQGGETIQNVKVNDYIPAGFIWVPANEPNWMLMGSTAMDTIPGPIAPGQSAITTVDLELVMAAPDQYVNIAEIGYFEDEEGDDITNDDIDSQADNDPSNDAGGDPGSSADDSNNGDGTGAIGGGDATTDEDDADPAFLSIPLIDLEKTLTGLIPAASGVDGNFDATFELVITNPGNQKLNMILLEDDLVEQLGANFVGITTPPAIVNLTDATDVPTVVPGYNGGVIDSIFNGMEGCLDPGQTITIEMVVEVTGMNGPDPIINEANVMGKDSFGIQVMDMDTAVVSAPDCFLSITCPNPNQGQLECLEDLPSPATDLSSFEAIDGFSAVDNMCGPLEITSTDTDNGGSGCIGDTLVITRVYTITDMGMDPIGQETVTCQIEYRIVDDVKPIIRTSPSDLTVDCSEASAASAISDWIDNLGGAEHWENCDAAVTTTFEATGDLIVGCAGDFSQEYTYTVTDACGNSVSEVAFLNNVGGEVPDPDFDLTDEVCWDGMAGSVVLSPTYAASPDVSSSWAITPASANVINSASGQITINATGTFEVCVTETLNYPSCATVEAGSCVRVFCETIIIVNDSSIDASFSVPTDICPGDVIPLTATESGGTFEGVGVVDNGDGTGTFTPTGPGDFSITYTLNSTGGCSNVFTQVVTVDQEAPVIVCPEDVIIECGPPPVIADPTTGRLVWNHNGPDFTGTSYAGDNFSNGLIGSVEDISFGPGIQLLDNNGNPAMIPNGSTFEHILTDVQTSNAADAIADGDYAQLCFTTNDKTTITTIQEGIFGDGSNGTSAGNFQVTAAISTDGFMTSSTLFMDAQISSPSPVMNFVFYNETVNFDLTPGTRYCIRFYLYDEQNNATLGGGGALPDNTVAFDDVDINLEECPVDEDLADFLSGASATDNCGDVSISTELVSTTDACGNTSTQLYRFTATDDAGNTSTCFASYTVVDTTPPTIDGPSSNLTLDCSASNIEASIDAWLNTASGTDGCGEVVVTNDFVPFQSLDFCSGNQVSQTVTFTAMDDCGNSSVTTAMVSIIDNTPPMMSPPANLTLPCTDAETTATSISSWLASVTATDLCDDDIEVTNNFTSFNLNLCAPGTTNIMWTATDICGNTTSVNANLIIEGDVIPPVLTVPANLTLSCMDISETADASALIAEFLDGATATDNCDSDPVITVDGAEGLDVCTASVTTITWTAVDHCGNTSTATATITIVPDTQAPVLTVPANLTLSCMDISETADASALIAEFLDGATATDNLSLIHISEPTRPY